jgi:uncharacterized protein (TIGR02270 family)
MSNGTEWQFWSGIAPSSIVSMLNFPILERHCEEVSYLWSRRDEACCAPNYRLKDLIKVDGRLAAHLDGLRTAHGVGFELCQDLLRREDVGAAFGATVLARGNSTQEHLDLVVQTAAANAPMGRAIVSGIGWLRFDHVNRVLDNYMNSEDPAIKLIAVGGFAVHRMDPGKHLTAALGHPAPILRARAIQAAAELGRADLNDVVKEHVYDADEKCHFAAAWSTLRLGTRGTDVISDVCAMVQSDEWFALQLLDIAVRVIDVREALAWHRTLRGNGALLRPAIYAAAAIGIPELIDDLVELTSNIRVARAAGGAIATITGVDLCYENLDADAPDIPRNNLEDGEANLPWPQPDRIAEWWDRHRTEYVAGRRYLAGQPITSKDLRTVLLTGTQTQRAAAALELALLEPQAPLFETRERGQRQMERLAWRS